MSAAKQSLKSLTFAVLPKTEANPIMDRRTKTIARLEEQKRLFADPTFTRLVKTFVKADDGTRSTVEKQQRVLPWWVELSDGSFLFTIRSGWRPIEFDKGKYRVRGTDLSVGLLELAKKYATKDGNPLDAAEKLPVANSFPTDC